jgi:outer membrane protein assembly factor BamB
MELKNGGGIAVMKKSAWILLWSVLLSSAYATDWPGWLGPGGLGISSEEGIPTQWDMDKNVKWKVPIPGLGHSSPIVWGNRIFVTTAVSSDPKADNWEGGFPMTGRAPDTKEISWQILCLDRDTGKLLWQRTAVKAIPVNFRHLKNSYASQTPVTDGTYVYAFFGDEGMFCYDFEGGLIWSRDLGDFKMRSDWGMGSSPVLYENLVFQTCDQETGESFIVALDKRTGKTVWKQEREELSSWSTPFLYLEGGRPELVVNATTAIRSYDPATGKLLWECRGPATSITSPTPISSNGLIIVSSGFIMDPIRPITAFIPGASGDITLKEGETKSDAIAWRQPTAAPYIPTPIADANYIYVLYDQGFFACYEARTGREVYGKKRIGMGANFSATPLVIGNRLFCFSEDGDVYVIKTGPDFELLATNSMGEAMMATPAVSNGMMFIRTIKSLYCIR